MLSLIIKGTVHPNLKNIHGIVVTHTACILFCVAHIPKLVLVKVAEFWRYYL